MSGEFGALIAYLGRERRAIAGTVVLVTTSLLSLGALSVLPAYVLGRAVVDGAQPPAWSWVVLGGLVALRAVLTWAEMDTSHSLAFRVLARLRMALFDRYAVALPTRRRENVGHAATTAMSDTERLEFFYAHTVAQLIAAGINLVIGIVILAVVDPLVALVVLAATAALSATGRVHGTRTAALGREVADQTSALSGRVVDMLGGLREVLGYRLQERVRAEVADIGAEVAGAAGRLETANRMLAAAREAVVTCTATGVLAVATLGDTRPAMFPAVVVLALVTVVPAADVAATIAQLHALRASAARVRKELHRPAVLQPTLSTGVDLPNGPLGLAFRNVKFGYDDRLVIDGFCLDVAPGEHVALAGPSGAGKSTVVALAGRLWDPDAGQVVLVGESSEVSLASLVDSELRQVVAVVEQDGRLFSGTVADNLLVHDRSTRADLVAGLRALDLAEVIGPDDQLGEGGLRLSGGQQVRLRLLRGILARPRVLVVDEPTADLDPKSAAIVNEVLYSQSCTLIVVSHQQSMLTGAHRVVWLENAANGRDTAGAR